MVFQSLACTCCSLRFLVIFDGGGTRPLGGPRRPTTNPLNPATYKQYVLYKVGWLHHFRKSSSVCVSFNQSLGRTLAPYACLGRTLAPYACVMSFSRAVISSCLFIISAAPTALSPTAPTDCSALKSGVHRPNTHHQLA